MGTENSNSESDVDVPSYAVNATSASDAVATNGETRKPYSEEILPVDQKLANCGCTAKWCYLLAVGLVGVAIALAVTLPIVLTQNKKNANSASSANQPIYIYPAGGGGGDSSTPVLFINTAATGLQVWPLGLTTDTKAYLWMEFSQGLSFVDYTLTVERGVKVTQANLRCAAAGETGPVVTTLFVAKNATVGVTKNYGDLVSGRLRNSNIVLGNVTDFKNTTSCGVTINNIASLYGAIHEGRIYLNLQTVAHPNGEARGQVYL